MTDVRRVVLLAARRPGLELLRRMIASGGSYRVQAVWTHRLLPRSESSDRAVRPDFAAFESVCAQVRVPLHTADTRVESDTLAAGLACYDFDYLVSLSWRYAVRPDALGLAKVAAVNLHRGKLPAYAGAEPVRRMLEAGEKNAVITAHRMVETIDAGEVLAELEFPAKLRLGESMSEAAERVKEEITPHYFEALEMALKHINAQNRRGNA